MSINDSITTVLDFESFFTPVETFLSSWSKHTFWSIDEQTRDDALQHTRLQAWKHMKKLTSYPLGQLIAYCKAIYRNKILRPPKTIYQISHSIEALPDDKSHHLIRPATEVTRADMRLDIHYAIERGLTRLPAGYREDMRIYIQDKQEGYTHQEMTERHGWSKWRCEKLSTYLRTIFREELIIYQ